MSTEALFVVQDAESVLLEVRYLAGFVLVSVIVSFAMFGIITGRIKAHHEWLKNNYLEGLDLRTHTWMLEKHFKKKRNEEGVMLCRSIYLVLDKTNKPSTKKKPVESA